MEKKVIAGQNQIFFSAILCHQSKVILLLLAARENVSLKHRLEASKHEAFYRTSYEIWNQKPYSLQQLKTKKLLSQTT